MSAVIVVLGCRTALPGRPGLPGAAARRVARAALAASVLAADGTPVPVLVCGGRRWDGTPEAVAMADALVDAGVPRALVFRELWSMTTRENARYAARWLEARGHREIALVTCDWHMPRAARLFRDAGLLVTPLPAAAPPAGVRLSTYRRVREWLSGLGVVP